MSCLHIFYKNDNEYEYEMDSFSYSYSLSMLTLSISCGTTRGSSIIISFQSAWEGKSILKLLRGHNFTRSQRDKSGDNSPAKCVSVSLPYPIQSNRLKAKQRVSSEFQIFFFDVLAESCERKISFKYGNLLKDSALSIDYKSLFVSLHM